MKNCSAGIGCSYRTTGTTGVGCSYAGYCAYQMPNENVCYDQDILINDNIEPLQSLLKQILDELKEIKTNLTGDKK